MEIRRYNSGLARDRPSPYDRLMFSGPVGAVSNRASMHDGLMFSGPVGAVSNCASALSAPILTNEKKACVNSAE